MRVLAACFPAFRHRFFAFNGDVSNIPGSLESAYKRAALSCGPFDSGLDGKAISDPISVSSPISSNPSSAEFPSGSEKTGRLSEAGEDGGRTSTKGVLGTVNDRDVAH